MDINKPIETSAALDDWQLCEEGGGDAIAQIATWRPDAAELAQRLAACWNACLGIDTGLLVPFSLSNQIGLKWALTDRYEAELAAHREHAQRLQWALQKAEQAVSELRAEKNEMLDHQEQTALTAMKVCDERDELRQRVADLEAKRDELFAERDKAEQMYRDRGFVIDILKHGEEAYRNALHRISLCSQNSASSKEECGRIACRALDGQCVECGSSGFKPSVTGRGCTFCDGTEGGAGPRT